MSVYHRSTHRLAEKMPSIVNWNGNDHNSLGRNLDEVPSRDMKIRNQSSTPTPKKVVHVNVSKADPQTQESLKRTSKKTGDDTYTYTVKKKEPKVKKIRTTTKTGIVKAKK